MRRTRLYTARLMLRLNTAHAEFKVKVAFATVLAAIITSVTATLFT